MENIKFNNKFNNKFNRREIRAMMMEVAENAIKYEDLIDLVKILDSNQKYYEIINLITNPNQTKFMEQIFEAEDFLIQAIWDLRLDSIKEDRNIRAYNREQLGFDEASIATNASDMKADLEAVTGYAAGTKCYKLTLGSKLAQFAERILAANSDIQANHQSCIIC